MRNSRMLTLIALAFIAISSTVTQAQSSLRCDLVSKDTTINGAGAKQCLDLDGLKGQTLTIPSNITRIDNQGFSLCTRSVTTGGDADIVFIVDQSGSMGVQVAAIDTFPGPRYDTLFFWGTHGCPGGSEPPNVPPITLAPNLSRYITVQTFAGTFQVPLMKSHAGCIDLSGDPYKARATAVSQAIDYISSVSATSTVGYLPFAANIQTPARSQQPLTLTAANITTLKNKIIIDSAVGTNYNNPLDSANKWLVNPSLIKTNKQAIIFISDGAPQPAEENGFFSGGAGGYRFNKNIPVYTIFLSRIATPDTANLKKISDTTRAAFYRVPSNRPDSLNEIGRASCRERV